MDVAKLKQLHDKAYVANQDTRERASDDLVFYWISQWDDRLLNDSQLQYKGEFNILRKAGRQIMADLAANPVQVNFEPEDETREDGADIIDGVYRRVDRENSSIEAYQNGSTESVVCGFGAWEVYAEYESLRNGDERQVIKRSPIHEANNIVFFDPDAKLQDKSDAKYCSVLHSYTSDGYKELVADLQDVDPSEVSISSFAAPEQSYSFPWYSQNEQVYVVDFYFKEKVKDKVFTMLDPFGMELQVRESELAEVMDEMIDSGYMIISKKDIERYQVTKYIASGREILKEEVIAGEWIPIIPCYGENAYVESQHHYEGVTRLAKDPQRLRNFQMSYLADIVSRSPRPKPIFNPEQLQGFEYMYEENGADNNYPYYLQNRMGPDGQMLPIGPVAQMPEQSIPSALVASINLSREAVDDVASPGLPQDVADPDLSGKAVIALQNRIDQQSMVYQTNLKHAKRHDGVVFASMATQIYSEPRKIKLALPSGQTRTVEMMQQIIDEETGELKTINDISSMEFNVYSDIGPAYTTIKQQTRDELVQLMAGMAPNDPMREIFMLKYVQLSDGVDFDDVREYARKQLIVKGIAEPDTEEEMQLLMQSQQSQVPDANMLLAQAEMAKGQAAMLREQRQGVKDQMDVKIKSDKNSIDMYKAESDRMGVMVDAQEAGATIENTRAKTISERLDNAAKLSGRVLQ